MKQILRLLLITASVLLAGCGGMIFAAQPSPALTEQPSQMINRILAEKDKYIGRQVTIDGKLEAEGQGLNVRFFLRADSGERLEVSSWAPLEVMHPPTGEAQLQSMASYVGRRWRLTGTVENAQDGIILNVSWAEEP
jgi:hypothetical protein